MMEELTLDQKIRELTELKFNHIELWNDRSEAILRSLTNKVEMKNVLPPPATPGKPTTEEPGSAVSTTSSLSSSSSTASTRSCYALLIEDNRALKAKWSDVRLEDLEDEMDDPDRFRSLAMRYAPFLIKIKDALTRLVIDHDTAVQIKTVLRDMLSPSKAKCDRETVSFSTRMGWMAFLGAMCEKFFNPTMPNQSGSDTKRLKLHFASVIRKFIFGVKLNVPYHIEGDSTGTLDLPDVKKIKADITRKFKYRTQTEYRLIDSYKKKHVDLIQVQMGGIWNVDHKPIVIEEVNESPRKKGRREGGVAGRPRLTANERVKKCDTSSAILRKSKLSVDLSPVKSKLISTPAAPSKPPPDSSWKRKKDKMYEEFEYNEDDNAENDDRKNESSSSSSSSDSEDSSESSDDSEKVRTVSTKKKNKKNPSFGYV